MTEESGFSHQAVLLQEAIEALNIKPDGNYIDATFGRAGHSKAILQCLGENGRLLALDKDPEAITYARHTIAGDTRFSIEHRGFKDIGQVTGQYGWTGRVDGLLMDLGVSSPQLDDARRGFSFLKDGELDMRMNPDGGMTAARWIATAAEPDMARIFKEYGEEKFSKRIARAIVKAREINAITRTRQLAEIIAKANPAWEKHKDPATRCFQAIRIYINRELDELTDCLRQSIDILADHGRLVVISFHSGEDRIVKRFIAKHVRGDDFPAGLPVTTDMLHPTLRQIGKPVRAGPDEVAANVRARSATMRVAERLARTGTEKDEHR